MDRGSVAEVSDFQDSIYIEKHVFQLEVSVSLACLVDMVDSSNQLMEEVSRFTL
jgi:hypothetical protein